MKFFKKLIIVATLILTFAVESSATEKSDSLWIKANDAYSMGEYNNALELYNLIEGENLVSSSLYYNMGNSYYKLGNSAKAILYYERALKLNPNGKDIINNLEIARLSTQDKIDVIPEFILTTLVKSIRDTMSSNRWAYCSLVLLLITLLFIIGYKFASSSKKRKISFFISCFTLLLTIFAMLFSTNLSFNASAKDYAIVVLPVSNVKSAPNATGNNIFILHDGAKVEILEEAGSWSKIELSDGRQGWTQSKDLEII